MKPVLHTLTCLFATLILTQCATQGPSLNDYAPPCPAPLASERASSPPPVQKSLSKLAERPGLGTQLGSVLQRDLTSTHFDRRHPSSPDATVSFHYNDEEGAKLMARVHGGGLMQHGGSISLIPGKLKVRVLASRGYWGYDTLQHYRAGDRYTFIGKEGREYEMHFENLTDHRLEIIVSVDGLDVLNGRPASVRNAGYVIPAESTIRIDSMRVGGVLRRLRFGSVADSQAASSFGEKGARNVGVIGVAMYEEDEIARRRRRVEENYIRDGARAFGN